MKVDGFQFKQLEGQDTTELEKQFSEEEVYSVLKSFNGDKAPGPDGFTMAFWQFSWVFVKEDAMAFFREFYKHSCFVKSLKDFRPISLVGGWYKWLAKVLANRLKTVLGKLISRVQHAFVEGRQILEATLIANEVIDSALKSNERAMQCKLDIEKAYDHVDWVLLFSVLGNMGFGEK